MSEDGLKRGRETIDCPICKKVSRRQGAQDYCDVYRCAEDHLTRVRVGTFKEPTTSVSHTTPGKGAEDTSVPNVG